MSFTNKLIKAQQKSNSWLCLGLDPDPARLPSELTRHPDALTLFNSAIIEATKDLVCAFKPNLSFYLAQGVRGLDALEKTLQKIPSDICVVLDAKFGDIEASSRGYAHFTFQVLNADAVTVSPYLGADALAPFLEDEKRAIFVLTHTSNPGAGDFQDALLGNRPLYVEVAEWASQLRGNAGLVVGATYPSQLHQVRHVSPSSIFLIPGVGTQGGDLDATVRFGGNDRGVGPLINASRSILYATGNGNFYENARAAALALRDQINAMRAQQRSTGDQSL